MGKTRHVTIFNHKGGVGKTTLTVNIAAALAEMGQRVLLVDADPQCNLSAYLLADEVVDELLDTSDSDSGSTLYSAVRPVLHQIGPPRYVEPLETGIEHLLLLPGDIRLSEFELALGDAWTDCLKRKVGGLRATTAIHDLARTICEDYEVDIVFYDVGPNIGPLNRALLLGSDYFIIPVACDLFSVRALATLGKSLRDWIVDWRTIVSLAPDEVELLVGRPRFLGYIPQRFRVYGQAMAKQPSGYLRQLKPRIYSDIVAVLQGVDMTLADDSASDQLLGQVKEFGKIVQDAQRQGVPLCLVEGSNEGHREEAWGAFSSIAEAVLRRVNHLDARPGAGKPQRGVR